MSEVALVPQVCDQPDLHIAFQDGQGYIARLKKQAVCLFMVMGGLFVYEDKT